MQKVTFLVLLSIVLCSFGNNGQSIVAEQPVKNQNILQQNRQSNVPTTPNGYTMRAKVNGKSWIAQSMMPPAYAGYHTIGYYKDEYISIPYSKTFLRTGKKIVFKQGEVAEVLFHNGCEWKENAKGEMTITKVDNNWAEGTFSFTTSCKNSDKNLQITDGFFRIPVEK